MISKDFFNNADHNKKIKVQIIKNINKKGVIKKTSD